MKHMKKLAAVLFMFVLLHGQCLAYVGGPFDPRNDATNVVGTYTAVMLPTSINDVRDEFEDDFAIPDEFARRSSIGIFSLSVPEAGPADGVVVIFDNGIFLEGTAAGFADPEGGELYAVLNVRRDRTVDGVELTQTGVGFVDGTITNDATGLFLVGLTRIEGIAEMAISNGFVDDLGNRLIDRVIRYAVDGVKQTNNTTDFTEEILGEGI